jgi:hypothetical protein
MGSRDDTTTLRRVERRSTQMICVSVEISERALTHRVRVTAPSIEDALKIAGRGKPGRRVRLLFPIDPEGFFIPGDHDRSRLPEMERADTTNRTKVANPPERDEAAHFRHSSVASESHGAEGTYRQGHPSHARGGAEPRTPGEVRVCMRWPGRA